MVASFEQCMQKPDASQQVAAEISPAEQNGHPNGMEAPQEADIVQAKVDTKGPPTFRDLFSLW